MTIPVSEREPKRDILRETVFDVRNRIIRSGIPEWMIHSGTIVKMFPYKHGLKPQKPLKIEGLDEQFLTKVLLDEPITIKDRVACTEFEIHPDGRVTTAIEEKLHVLDVLEVDLLGATLHDDFQRATNAEHVSVAKFEAFRVEVGL